MPDLLALVPRGDAGHYFIGVLSSVLDKEGTITVEAWTDAARRANLFARPELSQARCDRHVGEVHPPRCTECDAEQADG